MIYDIRDLKFPKELLDKMFAYFINLEWETDTYIINGKKVSPARKTYMFGKDYVYSGHKKKAHPFNKQIKFISKKIEEELNLPENYFNACLLNLYPNGKAFISYHKDNEKEMEPEAPIVSFSLGATRKFYIKKDLTKEVIKLSHKEGNILIMYPDCQRLYKHSIPKELKVTEPRISLTFRRFK